MTCINSNPEYVIQSGNAINPQNPDNSYLLLKPLKENKAVVIAGGSFNNVSPKVMTSTFELIDKAVPVFVRNIINIIVLVNDWITITGKYFIINPRLFR